MMISLFRKECSQTAKSLIYWLYIGCLVLFFQSQLGGQKILTPPEEGQENYSQYGYSADITEEDVMESGTGELVWDYYYDNFVTYPVGYAKNVSLSSEEKEKIADIIYDLTGLRPEEIEAEIGAYYEEHDIQTEQYRVRIREGLKYEDFLEDMTQVAKILGPGSFYTEERLWAQVKIPVDYEGAVKNYQDLIEKDGLTGGYARLFCDYMGILAGILPVFVTATRMLRDKRARMQELVFVRQAPSAVVMGSRYLALVCMHMLPILLLSLLPTAECIRSGLAVRPDYLAWLKYDLGWLMPTVMAVVSVGMLCTELTETALAVLVQTVWWFAGLMGGVTGLGGGMYGWNLVPRHNTEMNYAGFAESFGQLAANRGFYAGLSLAVLALVILVYERKRKGYLRRGGKILGNHKSTAAA